MATVRRFSCNKLHIMASAVLSAENRSRTIGVLNALCPILDRQVISKRKAAVLVPLCLHDGEIAMLLTLRAMTLRNNRGQVAFPGGMEDPSDMNLLDTALRETEEEIGIKANSVDVWGPGPAIGRPDMIVTPYLGYIGNFDPDNLTVNHQEVEKVFTASLSSMCNPNNFRTTAFRYGGGVNLPVFNTSKFRIWGLTAIIAHTILEALLPHYYTNTVERRIISSTSLPSTVNPYP